MTPEQMMERDAIWERVQKECPEFTKAHDITNNHETVREIVLGGSPPWQMANAKFKPEPGTRVMDIGANVGIYTAYAAVKGADVVAFEPYKPTFDLLAQMVTATGLLDRVTCVNAAVTTETGYMPFVGHIVECEECIRYNGGLQTDGVSWTQADFARAQYVNSISFEHAVGTDEWDFIKVDIEGGEFEMFLGAPPEIFERIRLMFVEFHPWASQKVYDLLMKKLQSLTSFEGLWIDEKSNRWNSALLARNLQKIRQ